MLTERADLVIQAAAWMQARGWKRKWAKKRGCEQSLFEPTFLNAEVTAA